MTGYVPAVMEYVKLATLLITAGILGILLGMLRSFYQRRRLNRKVLKEQIEIVVSPRLVGNNGESSD